MAIKSGGKTIFAKKTPVDSADTLRIKNFVEITLSRSISKINMFLCFMHKFRQNRSISLCFQDKQVFTFNTEIQDGRQKWWENNFCKKSSVESADTLWDKNFFEIAFIAEISRLTQKFKMVAKKTIFMKSFQ